MSRHLTELGAVVAGLVAAILTFAVFYHAGGLIIALMVSNMVLYATIVLLLEHLGSEWGMLSR